MIGFVDRPGSTAALRQRNTQLVLDQVRASGGMVQAEIARQTGLSAATVTNLVRNLAADGAVTCETRSHNGRRAKWVAPADNGRHVLGVDIGRTHLRLALVDSAFRLVGEFSRRLERGLASQDVLAMAGQAYETLLRDSDVAAGAVARAGVGVPGPIDQASGRIGASSLLPEWSSIDLREAVSRVLGGLPVDVDNDGNLGALGEQSWPPALESTSLFYVRLTTGIGGGLIVNGQLWRGADGTAGEIGHHSIDESGAICRCGNRGCLEAIASVPEFLTVLGKAVGREVGPDDWVQLAKHGDITARRLLEDLARHLGAAVANIINIVNPTRVVVGGPISAVGDILMGPLRAEVRQRAVPAATRSLRIEPARWGVRSEVYGAALMAMGGLADEGRVVYNS
jgi:predicted NBD/HSP70 family sugar kinase